MRAQLRARRTAALLATCAAMALGVGEARAQTSDATLEEVIVTARKRAESLSDAPATIAVVNEDKLRAVAVTSANELNGVVPGLVMMAGVGGGPGVTFRGLGSNSALFSVESSVALFVDGVYSAHTRDYVTPIYDLQRVEMVKGTQGTLLGKNTTLGAITMVTRRPGDELGVSLETSYDFKSNTPRIEAAVDLPINDQLKARISGLFIDDGGYVRNPYSGQQPDTRDVSGRLSLAWTPTPDFDATFIYQHDDHEQTGQPLEVLRDAVVGLTLANRALATGQTDFEGRPDRRSESGSDAFGAGVPAGRTPYDNQVSDRFNLIANWRVGGHTLTSQSAYVDWQVERLSDLDFLKANLLNLGDNEKNQQYSQEFRLTSPSEGRLTYVAGVYYFYNDWTLNRLLYGYQPSALFGSALSLYNQKTETISAFGQATYALTDKLNASVGLRYTNETKDATLFRPAGAGNLGGAFPAYPRTKLTNKEEDVDGDIGLQYKFEPGRMVYVSASKGSKGGGFQNSPTTVAGAPYTGETAYTVEAGGKFVFDRASLDVAVFQTTVENFQFSRTAVVGNPGVAQTVVTNLDVRSRGVELNGSLRVAEGLRLSGGVVYADSIFTETVPPAPAVPVAVDGLRQPRAPKWSGNLDANFSRPLTDELTLNVLGSVEFMSKTYFQPNVGVNLNAPLRDGFGKINLRVAVENEAAGWEIALLGKNLTDVTEPQFVTSVSGTGAGGNTPAWYGIVNPPRSIVLQFRIRR
ncbi:MULTISPECIES: TonB-dependent receptor [unclassified Phenylobacterium]|uniref:TonB-dependent receptor n=1 Tax=unclassified Phenylobacterium TaxID=2640670 RepID=UPI000ACEF9A7|nr:MULTISPECIES: TonB-dependent receptor [unclassified Phenylobacterium]